MQQIARLITYLLYIGHFLSIHLYSGKELFKTLLTQIYVLCEIPVECKVSATLFCNFVHGLETRV